MRESPDMATLEPTSSDSIDLPIEAIIELCRKHRVADLAVFGSALRADFGKESDIDFLVRFEPGAEKPWLGHFQDLQDDLSNLLGRSVDLVSRTAIEQSRNWIRRKAILDSARAIYAA